MPVVPAGVQPELRPRVNPELLKILVCPECRSDLAGELSCTGCSRTYPVVDGVPQMLASATRDESLRVAARFGEQWKAYSEQRGLYRRQLLDWLAPVEPGFFRDKLVLDAGCGKGRHLLAASEFGPRLLVGVDLGEASQVARAATRANPRVAVVRADLMHLPFRPGTFDYCYSVGVIHHTPDPAACFASLLQAVRPGGHISAWVYGRENNDWILRYVDPLREHLTSRLPRPVLTGLSRVLAAVLLAAGRGLYRPLLKLAPGLPLFYKEYLTYIASFPLREIETIVYDHLQPELAFYISREEFAHWFRDLEEVVIGWHNANSWRGFGRKPT